MQVIGKAILKTGEEIAVIELLGFLENQKTQVVNCLCINETEGIKTVSADKIKRLSLSDAPVSLSYYIRHNFLKHPCRD